VEQRLLQRGPGQEHSRFRGQLFKVTWLITIFIFLAVYQVYLTRMLEIRWRRWLTDRYLGAWLTDGAYYRMQLQATETDNPDQRIAEDVQLLAAHTLAFSPRVCGRPSPGEPSSRSSGGFRDLSPSRC